MNRPLVCNNVNTAGDELFVSTINGTTDVNNVCGTAVTTAGNPSSTATGIPANSSFTVNATLMQNAAFTITITDANNCVKVYTDALPVHASDVRCFGGNSTTNAKITICHQTGSARNPCVKICVDQSALAEHLAHGDYVGSCTNDCAIPTGIAAGPINQAANPLATILEAKASPNPSARFFNLAISGKEDMPVSVTMRDIFGRQLQRNEKVQANTTLRFGQNWAGGTYFIEVVQGKERVLLSVIKTN